MRKTGCWPWWGPSGGGKSTVANLLSRFWDVKQGQVLVRGRDIRDIPLSDLMDQISMVFQRVYLFQDTVYNNIAMGRTDATREEVYEAARKKPDAMTSSWNCPTALTLLSAKVEPAYPAESGSGSPLPAAF